MKKRKQNLRRHWRRPDELGPGLERAVKAAGGTMAHLARLLDITPQAIAQWTDVPASRMLDVERVTKVKREHLRPDLFRSVKRKKKKKIVRKKK